MGSDLDFLSVGNAILYKKDQPEHLKGVYTDKYELD
jgi:hypothetical protein